MMKKRLWTLITPEDRTQIDYLMADITADTTNDTVENTQEITYNENDIAFIVNNGYVSAKVYNGTY